jgi:glycosyltransferase involved in cell wall biosynthesis
MLQIFYEKYKDYVNISSQGLLLTNQKFNISKHPKISVIIPVYNQEIIIKRALRSIQNQNLKDIEIILINDFSTDNTLKTIKQFQNEDSRIKIINNKRNKGTLYSRCIGTLHSIGYYILPLDNDDMYLDKDIFNILYNEGLANNLDIIKFTGLKVRGLNNFFKKKIGKIRLSGGVINKIIIQPELSYFFLKRIGNKGNYISTEVYLWLKCIKNDVYKKAVILLGKERYSVFMTSGEDYIMNFIIFQTANSFKYIPKYGVLRIISANSANKIRTKKEKIISNFYYLNAVYDFSKNTLKGKEIVFCITINLMNRKLFKKIIQKKKYKLFFNNILIKIFNSKFIRRRDKILIKKKYKEFDINII